MESRKQEETEWIKKKKYSTGKRNIAYLN
jgi:hypothetical protein